MKHITYNLKNSKINNLIIIETLNILGKGGMVIFPSDTVYGLLVDATNENAVKKIFEFKNRPPGKPISVFVSNLKMMKIYVKVNNNQEHIVNQLTPGPFTVILKSKHKTSLLLESEKGNLGVRIPDFALINQLIDIFKKPVTATSANLSGQNPHYQIDTLLNELSDKKKQLIDLIIDIGKLPRNKPSTVIDLTSPEIKTIRKGDIVFKDEKTYLSETPEQTKKIAQFVLTKLIKNNQFPFVFILQGELGVGKTVFTKGIGETLGIKNIISPTFVIYYEYKSQYKNVKYLYHFDLYQIEEKEELENLGIDKLLVKGNVLCFEWGEKSGEIIDMLKKKAKLVYVNMEYIDKEKRSIKISY